MKIRNSSKIIAIVMALMMIVPLISVPTVAIAKVDGTKAEPVLFENFEKYEDGAVAPNNGMNTTGSTTTVATVDGNKVIKVDLKPATTNADGQYFIRSGEAANNTKFYVVTIDYMDLIFDENDNEIDVATGSVSMGGKTYYFKDAPVNFNYIDVPCDLYEDQEYTKKYTAYSWHLCSAAVRNALQGVTNIATPNFIGAGATGNTFVLSADYYFNADIPNKNFDFRMKGNNGDIHFGQFKTSASGVQVVMHPDLKEGITYNPGVTVPKGEWFNVTVIAESDGSKSNITIYVNGKIAGMAEQARAFSSLSNGWNLGHVTRNGKVDSYYSSFYVDNLAIYTTKDVIPSNWEVYDPNKIFSQNFDESTSIPSNLTWGGSSYEIVTEENGNNYIKLDAGIAGNQDKPITLSTGKVEGGIVQIDVDFYIPSDAQFGYQGQFNQLYAKGATSFGGTPSSAQSAYSWVDLYFVRAQGGKAWIHQVSDGNALAKEKTTIYDSALPVDKFFTLSTVINMATGEFMVFVDGVIAAKSYLFRTNNFLTDCYFNDAKLLTAKINKPSTAGMTNMSGALSVDNIVVKKIDAMPVIKLSSNEDFESYTAGTHADSPSNKPSAAPATATYIDLHGNKVVEVSLLGATEVTTLEVPFISTNSRSYDIKESVASFDPSQEITVELINSLTYTGSISGANDKPIYYAYVESEGIVYVYNAGGKALAADGANIGDFKLEKYTISDANYNGMFRAMCGGHDANIDKNFRVKHAPLDAAGTYVLSAEYFVDANASGIVQSQSYHEAKNAWLDLYRLDLTNKTFGKLNGATAGGEKDLPLIVNDWNTVTMIVTVDDDLSFSADIYLNGVYSHTKAFDFAFTANSWILVKIAKPSLGQVQKMAGYVYLDNVKVNAEDYDANKLQTIDATNVLGFDIDGKSIVNVSASKELKLYGADIAVRDGSFLEGRVLYNIVNTQAVASIRLQGPTGLRFVTEINAANLIFLDDMIAAGQIKGYNVGTLIAPTDFLSDEKALTFENFTEDVDMLDVEATVGMWYEGYDDVPYTTHFAGSIVNILTANRDRAFSGRGYIQVTMMNGEVITVYSAYTHSVSVAEQAQKTLDAGIYEVGSNEYNTLVGFAGN